MDDSMNRDSPTTRPANAPSPEMLEGWLNKIKQECQPKPMYTHDTVSPVVNLGYDCTIWLSGGHKFPDITFEIIRQTSPLWVSDGLTINEWRVDGDKAQILFSAEPTVAPAVFVARIKGRLQHALRQNGTPVKFSRKVAFRCLGYNTTEIVSGYLKKQVSKEGFVDPRFEVRMQEFTVVQDDVDLSEPFAAVRGRYWYNLHLVLVVDGRVQFKSVDSLAKLRDGCLKIARVKGYRLKSVSVMLEHIHLSLGGVPDESPEDIALAFMNNLVWIMGRNRIWQDGYYVGTFSEYTLKDLPSQRHKAVGDA